jgi:hypothetical protein
MKLCKHSYPRTIAILAKHAILWCKSCGAFKDDYNGASQWELPYAELSIKHDNIPTHCNDVDYCMGMPSFCICYCRYCEPDLHKKDK